MFISLLRIFKFAFQDFWRNLWLSLVTLFIIGLTLFSINFLVAINAIGKGAIKSVESKININLYFKPETSFEQIEKIKSYLASLDSIKEIEYISAEQALVSFEEKHSQNPILLESIKQIGKNPFGATLTVRAKSLKDYETLWQVIQNQKRIPAEIIENKDFNDYQLMTNRIKEITFRVREIGLALSLFFIVIAALVVFNTIRITIYTQREEIGIMKLVGATNWFIQAPFIMVSIIYGILAILIIIILFYPLLNFFNPYLLSFFEGTFDLVQYFKENFFIIFGWQLFLIIVLNILSSMVAIRRYLKV